MKKSSIMLTDDSYAAKREQVLAVATPTATKTWQPVANAELINRVEDQLGNRGFEIVQTDYALAKKDAQAFIVWHIANENREDMRGMLLARQSLDKSLSIMLAGGTSVAVCTNLCVFGATVKHVRKHTSNVMRDLHSVIESAVDGIHRANIVGNTFSRRLVDTPVDEVEGYRTLGELVGRKLIMPNQATIAYRDWQDARHPEFEDRNAWSLYNCATEGLKKSRPEVRAQQHSRLTSAFVGLYDIPVPDNVWTQN